MSSLPIDPHHDEVSLHLHGSPEPHDSEKPSDPLIGNAGPLSADDIEQIRLCSKRAKPIEKTVRYANFSGWTTLLAGVLSMPMAFGNTPMLLFVLVLAGLGTRELTLRRTLKQLDLKAPKKLAINQLMLGGALIIYAVFMLFSAPAQTMIESAMESDPTMQSTPELNGMMDDLIALEHLATALIYVGMIVLAVFFQGGTALYYFLKGSKLKKMHAKTPPWVLRVYRTIHS